jgi:CO/xanthine dehydrogenase Mo-binding subunit
MSQTMELKVNGSRVRVEADAEQDLPAKGAVESTMIALAPAIGNAIFEGTGMRLRSLPMRLPPPLEIRQ